MLDQTSAAFTKDSCDWLFTAIVTLIRSGKIHHRDGSTRRPAPIERVEDIPDEMGNLDQYIIILNQNWITLHDQRHRMHEEGVVIEPPKPKKVAIGFSQR